MFKANGIEISMQELRKLFMLADLDKSGAISMMEFKKISDNIEANERFRKLIRQIRKPQKRILGIG